MAERPRSWSPLLGLPSWALLGCTLLSNFDVQQCESNADCNLAAGGIQRCEEARCVPGCQDNHHCASFDPRTPICPLPGDPCASLTSDDGACHVSTAYDDATMGALRGSDMTIVGAFTPTLQSSTWLTLELAASELNEALGLAGAEGLAPVLVVSCHGSASRLASSVDHLVNRLRTRAVLGSIEDVGLQILAQRPAPEQVLLLNTRALGAQTEPQAMTWFLGGRLADVVGAYPALVRGVSQLLEQRTNVAGSLRIASLESEAAEDAALAAQITASIELDGKDARYLFREDRFRRFVLPDDLPEQRAAALQQLIAYAPDLILVSAGGTFAVPMAEARLAAIASLEEQAAGGSWSPLYLFGPRAADDGALLRLAADNPSFRERALGLSADRAADPRLAGALLERFGAAFPRALPAGAWGPELLAYDAFYHLVYAAAAAAERPALLPEALLDGLSRVVAPERACIDVGPDGIPAALQALRSGESFQLCGTTGPARFATDQARPAQARTFCWAAPAGQSAESIGTVSLDDPFAPGTPPPEPACARAFFPGQGAP